MNDIHLRTLNLGSGIVERAGASWGRRPVLDAGFGGRSTHRTALVLVNNRAYKRHRPI